ncbi:MAG: Photosystem I reaction center subunit IX [Leptolyngbya sp. ERB_1_1]
MPRYLSLNAVLAVVTLSVVFTVFILINWVSPDLLVLAQ